MIKVILADDTALVRDALSTLLRGCADVDLVAEADNFSQMMQLVAELRPDIVVMDLHMADEHRITPERVKASLNGSKLLAISIWNDEASKNLAKAFGAIALLDKPSLGDELIPSIRRYGNV